MTAQPAVHQPVTIRLATIDEIIDLRYRVLRAGLPRDTANFPGDDAPTTRHFGAFSTSNVCLGCVTLMLNTWQNQPAWQLRGMATEPSHQRRGLGTKLLHFAVHEVRAASPVKLLWCNARVPASPFYQKHGWTIASEMFEIPTAGPHYKMVLPPEVIDQ